LNRNANATSAPRLTLIGPDTSFPDAADATYEVLEEMHHPISRFSDPSYATLDLLRLAREFDTWLAGKERPAKPPSRQKYASSLKSLFHSIQVNDDPLELAYLHHTTVTRWIAEQRARNMSEDGIASRLASVKVFAHGFVFRRLELSERDLLDKVSRFTPPPKPMPVFNEQEMEQILGSFDQASFEGIRDRAMVGVLLATGVRRGELHRMTMPDYDVVSAEIAVTGKVGREVRWVGLSERAHKLLKAYLKVRPRSICTDMWLQRSGGRLGEWGIDSLFRRVKARCGIARFHAHLCRHTAGTLMLRNSGDRALVKDALGHQTDLMSIRYSREERKRSAAKAMPRFAAI
jgi:integrase/recombinase XerC